MDEKYSIGNVIIFLLLLFSAPIYADQQTLLDYFQRTYQIIKDNKGKFKGIEQKPQTLNVQEHSLTVWLDKIVDQDERKKIVANYVADELDTKSSVLPLCRADKKFFFYTRKLARDGVTAAIRRVLQVIPIAWLVAPVNYLIGRVVDLNWEKHRYHQEGLAYILQHTSPTQLGLEEKDVARCLSSIQEAQHALYDIHLLLRAWNKWDRYGTLERKKLRAKAETNRIKVASKYRSIGAPLTDNIYPVVSKKGSTFLGNFSQSAFWFTKRPSISYWTPAPALIAGMRWSFEVVKFATTFIPLPILPSLLRSPFNRAYAKQVQYEGQLFTLWSVENNPLRIKLLQQTANPYLLFLSSN